MAGDVSGGGGGGGPLLRHLIGASETHRLRRAWSPNELDGPLPPLRALPAPLRPHSPPRRPAGARVRVHPDVPAVPAPSPGAVVAAAHANSAPAPSSSSAPHPPPQHSPTDAERQDARSTRRRRHHPLPLPLLTFKPFKTVILLLNSLMLFGHQHAHLIDVLRKRGLRVVQLGLEVRQRSWIGRSSRCADGKRMSVVGGLMAVAMEWLFVSHSAVLTCCVGEDCMSCSWAWRSLRAAGSNTGWPADGYGGRFDGWERLR